MPSSATVAEGAFRRTPATLTHHHIVGRIRRWAELYGEPPGTADWAPALARWRRQEWRIERYRAGDPATGEPWPATNTVKRRFDGSFDAAIRAAGLEPRRPGPSARPGPAVEPHLVTDADAPVARRGGGGGRSRSTRADATTTDGALSVTALLHDAEPLTRGTVSRAPAIGSPDALAAAVRRVAECRSAGQRRALEAALADVAAEALRWRARL